MPLIGDLRLAGRLHGEGSSQAGAAVASCPALLYSQLITHNQPSHKGPLLFKPQHLQTPSRRDIKSLVASTRNTAAYNTLRSFEHHQPFKVDDAGKPGSSATLADTQPPHQLGQVVSASYARLHRVSTLSGTAVARFQLYTASNTSLNDPFD